MARVRAGTRLWRIHRATRSPWWFCADGQCRFDLGEGEGTCYLAGGPVGCVVEVFRDLGPIPQTELDARRLARFDVSRSLRLANVGHESARGYGCTAEIHTTTDYDLTQKWALALRAAGFDGIRYLLRHDPSQRLAGYALFGAVGDSGPWPPAESVPVPQEVVIDASRRFGLTFVRTP